MTGGGAEGDEPESSNVVGRNEPTTTNDDETTSNNVVRGEPVTNDMSRVAESVSSGSLVRKPDEGWMVPIPGNDYQYIIAAHGNYTKSHVVCREKYNTTIPYRGDLKDR